MKKTDKINFIIKTLEDLFPKTDIPLNHKDPYTLLIAVLLSAQSTDAGVNKITPILFKKGIWWSSHRTLVSQLEPTQHPEKKKKNRTERDHPKSHQRG